MFIAKLKNGFTPQMKREIAAQFGDLRRTSRRSPICQSRKGARRGEALTAEAMKNYQWLKPELVAQVEFTDWTDADHLRHARFVALRDDKDAREVTREAASG